MLFTVESTPFAFFESPRGCPASDDSTFTMTPTESRHRFRIMLSFLLVYVFWGSTYLAMRIAVRDLPPYVLSSVRYMISGPVMLAWCAVTGKKIGLDRHDFLRLLAIGVLLLSISNVGVIWAEEYVPSGLAALIVAFVPVWVVALEAWVFRSGKMPLRGVLGLMLGVAGMIVLLWPKIVSGTHLGRLELFGVGILLAASLSWSLGSILSHRWTLSVDVFTAIAWQMTLGGLVSTLVALSSSQFPKAHWTADARWATVWLVTAGSWIGFTAYIWLLEHVPPPKVATYAYVNPIVALLLGWWLLHERIDLFTVAGSMIIVGAVALVNTAKLHRVHDVRPDLQEPEIAAVGGD